MADGAAQPDKKAPGLFDFTPEQQKKATLIFLVSLGTTLLITGRSGGKLLKRAKASEGSAAAPAGLTRATAQAVPTTTTAARPAPPPPSLPRVPPSTAPETVKQPPISLKLPPAPPSSFLHPNSLTPPKPRRLLQSFVASSPASSSPDGVSILSSRPAPSAYFLPNPTLLSQSTAYASQLDKLDKLHEEGEEQPQAPEDGFNPALYAMKALGIATAITFSSFGLGIYGLMRYFEAEDLDSLALALQHQVSPVLDSHRPSLPSWALPSAKPDSPPASSSPNSPDATPDGEEELSYWASLKEELDREAEERKAERRAAWERMKRKAAEGGGAGEQAV
ncbi:hypothetical protein JCM8547_003619 [Rhodosporidiobolus lusitaniae]